MTTSPNPTVLSHLTKLHAAERAQCGELRILRDQAKLPALAALLDQHLSATKEHGDLLEARLEELGSGPGLLPLVQYFGSAMVKGTVERLRPGGACSVLRDAIVAEAEEISAYLALEQEAIRAGDTSTAVLAAEIRSNERTTLDQLRGFWHQAVHRDIEDAELGGDHAHVARRQLVALLQDAHAVERSAASQLAAARTAAPNDAGRARIDDHRSGSSRHGQDVAIRLAELDARPSLVQWTQGSLLALFAAPLNAVRNLPLDRTFHTMYATEHLEVAIYEQMSALAEAAGDDATEALAERHLPEELAMIDWLEREAGAFLGQDVMTTA